MHKTLNEVYFLIKVLALKRVKNVIVFLAVSYMFKKFN